MISACLLNYHRPELLKNIILPVLETSELIDEIIVSHGREDTAFQYTGKSGIVVHRHDYGEVNNTYGLSRRWLCWQQAKNEAVLSLDDDILVSCETVFRLYESYKQKPQVIHSLVGRGIGKGLRYLATDYYGDVKLALTGVAMLPASLGRACLEHKHLVDDFIRKNSRPLWNGEDLFSSLLALKLNKQLNKCLRLSSFVFLSHMASAKLSVSEWENHYAYRTELLREVAEKLDLHNLPDKVASRPRMTRLRPAHVSKYLKSKLLNMRFRVVRDLLLPRHKSPDFIIIGGHTCGVGALYQSLGEHLEIQTLPITRPNYFIKHFQLGKHNLKYHAYNIIDTYQYRKQFPYSRSPHISGEASELYLYVPEVPSVLSELCPQTRFIVLTRDPAERAWAAYHRQKNHPYPRNEPDDEKFPTFAAAISYEQQQLNKGMPLLLSEYVTGDLAHDVRCIRDMKDERGRPLYSGHHGYLTRGMFACWLKHWYQFFDPERFLVLSYEELFSNPSAAVRRVHTFLGLEALDCAPYADPGRGTPPIDEDARKQLNAYFEPTNRELSVLAGKAPARGRTLPDSE